MKAPPLFGLAVQGRGRSLPLPMREVWLLDPHDPLSVLASRLTRWIAERPGLWLVAQGGAAAVLLTVAAARLDLRLAGVALIGPAPWVGRRDRLGLPDAPLPFPLLLAGERPVPLALARAWSAIAAPDPLTDPDRFLSVLAAQAGRGGRQPSISAKARSDLASSTEEIASRTSSMVARTAQVASSGQSVQGR